LYYNNSIQLRKYLLKMGCNVQNSNPVLKRVAILVVANKKCRT